MDVAETWRSYATICRLCLQKDGFMLGIFNHIQDKEKSIHKKIIDCTALQISLGDGLPNVICHRCLYKIEFCLDFRKLCFMSDATLRQFNAALANETQNGGYEQLANGSEEDVVMVVDPNTLDYESEYESEPEAERGGAPVSDNEITGNSDTYGGKNVSMCRYCDHAFTDKAECAEHERRVHDSAVPYNCGLCDMSFADRLQYSAHLKGVHQNDKPYGCPQCERTFARRSDLRKHTVVHTGIKPFTCTVCFKSFSRNTNLSKHMRIHSDHKPYACAKCPKSFFSKGDLTRHGLIHSGQKPFRCNYCNLSFGRKDKLIRHEKRHFVGEEKAADSKVSTEWTPCESETAPKESESMVISVDPFNNLEVKQEVASETDLTLKGGEEADLPPVPAHITGDSFGEEDEGKKYSCSACPKRFSTPENMRYHHATHSGIRPHVCNICKKSFIRKRELDRHFATHTGMKPFKCNKCSKSFGRKDKLVRHLRIHDVNKEHSCEICAATFNRRDGLVQHMKTHEKMAPESLSPVA